MEDKEPTIQEVLTSLDVAYIEKATQLIGLVQEGNDLIEHIQSQRNLIGQFNKRQMDLGTLETMRGLLEAQVPVSGGIEETKYEAVFSKEDKDKEASAIKKTILAICKQIHKEYTDKKDGE